MNEDGEAKRIAISKNSSHGLQSPIPYIFLVVGTSPASESEPAEIERISYSSELESAAENSSESDSTFAFDGVGFAEAFVGADLATGLALPVAWLFLAT